MCVRFILSTSLAICLSQVFGGVILRGTDDNEICESKDCFYTANHILKWLNPEADPCEDFYEFACGNWRNLPTNERVNKSLGSRDSLVKQFVPVLLKDPSATNGKKYFENLRNFMITCMDNDTIQSVGVTPIKQLIQKAGGWPVLDSDWSEEVWDFLNAEISLGSVLIEVDTTYFVAENSSVVTFLINLGPSPLITRYTPDYEKLVEGLKNESTKTYYDTMVDVAVALGADKEVAEKAMKEVLEFETALLGELKNANYSNEKTITLEKFQEAVPLIDFTKLLKVYLPESYELLPDENIIAKQEFFLVLQEFFYQYPSETVVNYMLSKAVYPLFQYVNSDLNISPYVDYGYDDVHNEQSRFDYCSDILQGGSLGPALAAYLGSMYTESSKTGSEMTQVIIAELAKEVEETDWLDEVTRQEAAKNISEIRIDVGFPPKIMDWEKLDELYEGYEMDTSNFFDAMMYDKKWVKQRDFDRLHKNITSPDELDYLGWKYYIMKGLFESAHFIPGENIIEVSGPMLNYVPLFSAGNPAYVNYGHVGTIVAHELIHAVDLNAAPAEAYFLEMEKWGSNQTENIYIQKKQCFIKFYSSINDTKTTQLKLNGKQTEREDMADNGGIKLSLRAYRKLADQMGFPERKLPGLQQYSIEQLFMISVANPMCEIPYRERRIRQLKYDTHSPFEFRVNGMMMNSPDFSEIFNCDKKDPMNPPDKCEVW